jgi:hydrophobic/amphiphilic exporter-1 (mainly G- bacteria), HAE1 family
MTQILRRAVERPISTLIGALTLVVLGTVSLLRLPVSLLPTLERPRLDVTVTAPGRSREEVLDRLTRPLERRLAALAGVTSVRTTTGDGFTRARVESEWQTDADRLRIETERRLADLDPTGESALTVEMTAGDAEPIVEVAVLGGGSGAARTDFARKLLVPELARLEGAGKVETVGLTPRHAVVRPRAAALAARGLTAADLVQRLGTVGIDAAAGRARSGMAVRPLLVREEAASLEALRALRIPGPRGESVLGDVAGVGLEEVQDGTFFRLAGEDGVLVRIYRAPEANAVALAARVRERTAALAAGSGTGSGLKLAVVDDRSREVLAALGELGLAALLGLALGTAVLRLLLGRWRPTLGLAVVVPASLLTAFAGFYLWGASLDVVSLAGLALAAGMLVDSSIVVLEAIETARAQGAAEPAVTGARQIALPVIASFCTTAVVFLPLIYLKGLARAFFGVQAFAIVSSLAASLLFSLTVTPVLSGNRGRKDRKDEKDSRDSKDQKEKDEKDLRAWGRSPGRGAYLRLLEAVLARPALAVVAALAVTAFAGLAVARLPRELVPAGASRELVVRWRLTPDLTPEAARRLGSTVEAELARAVRGKADRLALQLTPPEPGEDRDETGRLVLAFPDAAGAAQARPLLRVALDRLPGVEAWIEPRPSAFVEAVERAGRRLEVVATASTPERAAALASNSVVALGSTARESTGRRDRPQQAVLLAWDLPRLASLGADRTVLEKQVRDALGDQTAGRLRLDGVEPEIRIRAVEPADPALLPVAASGSGKDGIVPLAALARLVPGARPPVLERLDGRPAARRVFDAVQGDPEAALARLSPETQQGAGEEIALGGQALELRRAFGQLRLALGLSLVLVFLTVAALYESFRIPLVVMTTVPVALGGALGLLLITGQSLNILSFLGLILLAGIVVNNAIVLVHRIEEHRRSGRLDENIEDAIRRAAGERYRPILMTTICTVAGMLPLAVLGGAGVELRRSLALAVMGGTLTSVFASLLLVPVLHRALVRRRAEP